MSVEVGFKKVGKFVEIYVVGTWVENAVDFFSVEGIAEDSNVVDKYVVIIPFEDCPKEFVVNFCVVNTFVENVSDVVS